MNRSESHVQLETQVFVGVESSGAGNQALSQIGMHLPRAAPRQAVKARKVLCLVSWANAMALNCWARFKLRRRPPS